MLKMADNYFSRNAGNEDAVVGCTETGIRVVTLHKTETGFGFQVSGQDKRSGKMNIGRLFAPRQRISDVTKGGAAEKVGMKKGDEILEVNGKSVKGITEKQVVDLITSKEDVLSLTIISAAPQEAEDPSGYSYIDYKERVLFPISISEYCWVDRCNEKYVLYSIQMTGRLCFRRYREFSELHVDLKREFPGFTFPKLPGKTLFVLSDKQLEARRLGLEQYLQKVCTVKIIGESKIMQDFLTNSDDEYGTVSKDMLPIRLPGGVASYVSVRKNCSTEEAYQAFLVKSMLSEHVSPYFALFEIAEEDGFERKLQPSEHPYVLYKQRSRQDGETCIAFRKWLFNFRKEAELIKHGRISDFFIWQAIDDISKGQIKPASKLHELKTLVRCNQTSDYLSMVKSLKGYGEIPFPPCACDTRKDGPVVATVGFEYFKLHACKDDGTAVSQVRKVKWDAIKKWKIDEKSFAFMFQYNLPGKEPRWLKIFTRYYNFMFDCFERVQEERKWFCRAI